MTIKARIDRLKIKPSGVASDLPDAGCFHADRRALRGRCARRCRVGRRAFFHHERYSRVGCQEWFGHHGRALRAA